MNIYAEFCVKERVNQTLVGARIPLIVGCHVNLAFSRAEPTHCHIGDCVQHLTAVNHIWQPFKIHLNNITDCIVPRLRAISADLRANRHY